MPKSTATMMRALLDAMIGSRCERTRGQFIVLLTKMETVGRRRAKKVTDWSSRMNEFESIRRKKRAKVRYRNRRVSHFDATPHPFHFSSDHSIALATTSITESPLLSRLHNFGSTCGSDPVGRNFSARTICAIYRLSILELKSCS